MARLQSHVVLALVCISSVASLGWSQDAVWRAYMPDATKAPSKGRYAEAERLFALAVSEAERFDDDDRLANSLDSLASVQHDEAHYDKAEILYQQACEIARKGHGAESANVAISLNNLATLYRDQARYEDAESLCIDKHSQSVNPISKGRAGGVRTANLIHRAKRALRCELNGTSLSTSVCV